MWQSDREMERDIFEELAKERRSFWNNVDVSILFSQDLN